MYPTNTLCTYIIDGLKGDQNLEQVVLRFETVNMLSDKRAYALTTTTTSPTVGSNSTTSALSATPISTVESCEGTFVGVSASANSMSAVVSDNEESWYDVTLCENLKIAASKAGPYTSQGPRMIVVFSSSENATRNNKFDIGDEEIGFKAKIEFKTGKFNVEICFIRKRE